MCLTVFSGPFQIEQSCVQLFSELFQTLPLLSIHVKKLKKEKKKRQQIGSLYFPFCFYFTIASLHFFSSKHHLAHTKKII